MLSKDTPLDLEDHLNFRERNTGRLVSKFLLSFNEDDDLKKKK
jgi:hypothetical protein